MKEFLLNVAHELKTPLTILKGESELALGKPLTSEEAQQLTTTYLEETIRMARIVDDLLTLARADAGQVQLRQEPVQLDALLQELYEDAVILSAGKPLTVTLAHNEPAVVTGDPEKLRQMFRALVSNAVRYTDAGGSLTIRSSTTPTTVSVDFEDTGVGIPPESLGRIFDRFYRVDAARARATGGSGLGLSIARWIAEAHHGTIGVRSTPGKGSCFTVTIPCRI
jgi:signal transduction histidine kinase